MRRLAILIATSGCGFEGNATTDAGPGSDGVGLDMRDTTPRSPPLHLGPGDGDAGTGALVIDGVVTIDTGGPTLSIPLPDGVTFDVRPQLGGGPDLAVLHVGTLTVTAAATLRALGTRPLVIVADGAVTIDGLVDASAHGAERGCGGASPAEGTTPGLAGEGGENLSDTGGGGGGHGSRGANGGNITGCGGGTLGGGVGGDMFGDATIARLAGGSGGGPSHGLACTADLGGAGGGALQITSYASVVIEGAINAGGGGGSGGTDCGAEDVNSGPGGGAGGAIVLEARAVVNGGVLAANGGGGGGSSSTGMGNANPGEDGLPSATLEAKGGMGPRAQGGRGAVGGEGAGNGGPSTCGNNAAGGGGGIGRIAIAGVFDGSSGAASPAPLVSAP